MTSNTPWKGLILWSQHMLQRSVCLVSKQPFHATSLTAPAQPFLASLRPSIQVMRERSSGIPTDGLHMHMTAYTHQLQEPCTMLSLADMLLISDELRFSVFA